MMGEGRSRLFHGGGESDKVEKDGQGNKCGWRSRQPGLAVPSSTVPALANVAGKEDMFDVTGWDLVSYSR